MSPSRAAILSVLVLFAPTLAVAGNGFATGATGQTGSATGEATYRAGTIESCTTIDEPGVYALDEDILENRGTRLSQTCIRITADDVVLDGRGHVVDGRGISDTTGVGVVNAGNVTVRDLGLSDWNRGVHYDGVSGGAIRGVNATRNARGIDLDASSDVVLADNEASRNLVGVDLNRRNHGVSLEGNAVTGNFYAGVDGGEGNVSQGR